VPKTTARFDLSGYALVADRIALFYRQYPTGRIVTELHSRVERNGAAEVTFRAAVYRSATDAQPAATGWASEREGDGEVNAVACLENAETSAVGRALANLGFAASLRRAGGEEIARAARDRAPLALHRVGSRPSARAPVRPDAVPPHALASADADDVLQEHADVVVDLLALVDRAEAAGLRAARADALRRRLLDATPPDAQLERLERLLRGWLRRQAL
jgi:hypothetical protein